MSTAATRSKEVESKEVRLDLEGITCASCVNRIERKLNKLEGVDASVNFATEQATVRCDPAVTVDDLVAAVEAAGYHAHPVTETTAPPAITTTRSPQRCSGGASSWRSP